MRRDLNMAGKLYVVATPLGNLGDITLRALSVLKEVSFIAAEDTRHSRKLLDHYGITTPVTSYYDQVEKRRAPHLVERLKRGESLALISDAGTPGIADPGYHLVRAALDADVQVVPIPGPSMMAAALSVSGLPTHSVAFEGFVPARAMARRKFYAALRDEPRTVVCFEAARRLMASLTDLASILGERDVVVAREVTKLFEEFVRGTAREIVERVVGQPMRGEVTLVIGPPSEPPEVTTDEVVRAAVERLRDQGMRATDIARIVALETGRPRADVYRLVVEMRDGGRG